MSQRDDHSHCIAFPESWSNCPTTLGAMPLQKYHMLKTMFRALERPIILPSTFHFVGATPNKIPLPPIAPGEAPSEAGTSFDLDQHYELRDHRAECDQILQAGAF